MWKRKNNTWQFFYEGKKVGLVVASRSNECRTESVFSAIVNGKILATEFSLSNAKYRVEAEF